MAALSDGRLYEAGMSTDEVLGFRTTMSLRPTRPVDTIPMPDHFWDPGREPRVRAFRRGVEIARAWRAMRTGAGIARRERRNQQFRNPPGAADPIDRDQVREEAWTFLLEAIGQVDGFVSRNEIAAHRIAAAVSADASPREIDLAGAVVVRDPADPHGILVALHPAIVMHARRAHSCAESLYQIQKFPRDPDVQDLIAAAPDGFAAKEIARSHEARRTGLRTTFHKAKAMARALLRLSDQHPPFKDALIGTGDRPIVEVADVYESPSDALWGSIRTSPSTSNGCNVYGRILAEIRSSYPSPDAGSAQNIHPDA